VPPDGGTGKGANRRANRRAAQCRIICCLLARRATDLLKGKITAHQVIGTKFLEILARSRQCHDIGAGRRARATGNQQQTGKWNDQP
jgi:hypothetical protein